MKHVMFSCVNSLFSIVGLAMAALGIGTMPADRGRLLGVGLILIGLTSLPYRKNIPEWRPQWTGGVALAFGLGFIILGLVIFVVSWLQV